MNKKMNENDCVIISGGFDPIHVGHLRMIQESSKLASRLIVIANSDKFLIEKKGYAFMPVSYTHLTLPTKRIV